MSKEQQNHEPPSETRSNDAAMIEAALREARTAARAGESPGSDAVGFTAPPPDAFAGYDVIDEVHRGGQGVVFRAIQKATRREVAIKVRREGPFTSQADAARFEREVQVLGQLSHPNIVTVHDTGVAGSSHYFVMDYVSGQPLDVSLARGDWSIDETLRLFAKICAAVNAAHLRGVIHRDLKPSNILIDDDGEPQILDFGLAKVATGPADAGDITLTGQFVGSLPWASPEQAEGKQAKVDMRTDVYSLGVILYQMLTRRFPYEVVGNMRDVIDNILSAEPARPSTIRVAAGPRTGRINDEVETIVLKCLQKERDRRYQTAGELARDVNHYLNGEPIEAKRDSAAYVLRKQLKRHKLPLTIAAGFVAVVTAGFVTSLTFWHQAADQRYTAQQAQAREAEQRKLAQESAARAETEAEEARTQAAIAQAVNQFLNEDLLAAVAPSVEEGRGRDVTMREVLDVAAQRIKGRFADQPLVEAAIRTTLGETYRKLGLLTAAEPHLVGALEIYQRAPVAEHQETANAMDSLARLYTDQARYEEAELLAIEALAMRKSLLPAEHPDTLDSMETLASLYVGQGRHEEAEPLYTDVLAIRKRVKGVEHPSTLISMQSLATLYMHQFRYQEAEALLTEALAIRRRVQSVEDRGALITMNVLAEALRLQGRYEEAEALFAELLPIQRRILGDEHPDTLTSMNNLANVYNYQKRYELAEPLYLKVLEVRRQKLGNDHPDTLSVMNNLGMTYNGLGRFEEAEPLLKEVCDRVRKVLPEGDWRIGTCLFKYGHCLFALKRYAEAEENLLEAYRISLSTFGPEARETIAHVYTLTRMYETWDVVEPGQGHADKAAEWRAKLPATQPTPTEEQPTSGEE